MVSRVRAANDLLSAPAVTATAVSEFIIIIETAGLYILYDAACKQMCLVLYLHHPYCGYLIFLSFHVLIVFHILIVFLSKDFRIKEVFIITPLIL